MHDLTEDQIALLWERYLTNTVYEPKVSPGHLEVDTEEYAEIFANLCDAVIQTVWPKEYAVDPRDPEFHTSDKARRIASVLMVAAGYRVPVA